MTAGKADSILMDNVVAVEFFADTCPINCIEFNYPPGQMCTFSVLCA